MFCINFPPLFLKNFLDYCNKHRRFTKEIDFVNTKSSVVPIVTATSSSMRPVLSILPTTSTIQRLVFSMVTIAPKNEPMVQKAAGAAQFTCPAAGLYPDPSSCYHFYSCHFTIEAHRMTCGGGLTFNPKTKTCDWPSNSQCPLEEHVTCSQPGGHHLTAILAGSKHGSVIKILEA
uniref:Chitin-binding type-2 domain-containing protein n=1 Tax=Romanomermis culicivorax TaxID=13658 RepID=A0A915JJM2_ROMCU